MEAPIAPLWGALEAFHKLFPLPVEEKAFSGLSQVPPKCPRASEAPKSSKTYQNRAVFPWTSASFRNRIIRVLAMDLACACDGSRGLPPLPVKEKAVSWTWCANAMCSSLCLSKKRPSSGSLGMLAIAFSPCLSKKIRCQGLRAPPHPLRG